MRLGIYGLYEERAIRAKAAQRAMGAMGGSVLGWRRAAESA